MKLSSAIEKVRTHEIRLQLRSNHVHFNCLSPDVILWTSDHVTEWVESLGLDCSTVNLRERGVHGGVVALDNDYGYEKLAMALQIPLTDIEVVTVRC